MTEETDYYTSQDFYNEIMMEAHLQKKSKAKRKTSMFSSCLRLTAAGFTVSLIAGQYTLPIARVRLAATTKPIKAMVSQVQQPITMKKRSTLGGSVIILGLLLYIAGAIWVSHTGYIFEL